MVVTVLLVWSVEYLISPNHLHAVAGIHVRKSMWVHPMMAAVNKKIKKAAAFETAISKAAMSSDGASTVSTVLWESRADVDDRAGSDDDGEVEAAGGAAATVSSMQVVEEAIDRGDRSPRCRRLWSSVDRWRCVVGGGRGRR